MKNIEREYTVDEILAEVENKRIRFENIDVNNMTSKERDLYVDRILAELDAKKMGILQKEEIQVTEKKPEKKGILSKLKLVKEQIGKKALGLIDAVKNNKPKKTKIGALALTTAVIMSLSNCSKPKIEDQNKDNLIPQTTTTQEQPEEIIVTTTVAPVTTTKEFTTTAPITTTVPVTTTKEFTTTPQETTVVETTPEEVIVTKPATTTAPVVTTTVAPQTTTKPAETTTKEEQVKPIVVKDLDKKVKTLKKELESKGIHADTKRVEDLIRVLYSDFIAHDGYEEITAIKYEKALQLLSVIGSYNNVKFAEKYDGNIPKIEDTLYIPTEVMTKEHQDYLEEFEKITEDYKKALNKVEITLISELTPEEEMEIIDKVYAKLDKMNIKDPKEWEKEYIAERDKLEKEKLEKKQSKEENKTNKAKEEIYGDYSKEVIALINEDEYLELTQSEKLWVFTTISGAMTSGLDEKSKEAYMELQEDIKVSANEMREILIIQNRKNKNQPKALEEIIKENKEQAKEEREDLQTIVDRVLNGDIKVYVR